VSCRRQPRERLWHVALQIALKGVRHDRAHHRDPNGSANGAEEVETGRDLTELPVREGILDDDGEEAQQHASAQAGNDHVADDLARGSGHRHA